MGDTLKIPIGQQNFVALRERGFLYIDKTDLILRMIEYGDSYFLSRPRRMGKSLLVSTLRALFEGRRELFEGLAIAHAGYDFRPYHVIHLNFGSFDPRSPSGFEEELCETLRDIADAHGCRISMGTALTRTLVALVETLAKTAPVVILIDEYDLPVLRNLKSPGGAQPFIDVLSIFFTAVKSLYPYLRFTFITGVSRFSKTTIFSGMNHLRDLSLMQEYATLLGITEEEIKQHLLPWSSSLDQEQRDLVRQWYNGYRFAGDTAAPTVYNPHSLFSFIDTGKLTNHWFQTGTPTFAINLVRQTHCIITEFETGVKVPGSALESSFEVDNIVTELLLYQTGYLTITDYDSKLNKYTLGFPNEEVRRSFFESLSTLFFKTSAIQSQRMGEEIIHALQAGNVGPVIQAFNKLLGQLAHSLLRRDEAYYHSMTYIMLRTIGLDVDSEKSCCKGRLDMGLRTGNKAYVFEFKRDSSAAEAIRQIHERQYARAYAGEGLDIYLVGINVNSESCAIDDWIVEPFAH